MPVSDENNHITGTVGDFNNLIDRFEALGDYFDALRVCDFALKIYPRSATLLAITLNTCARSGADGETYLAAAESLGRENWNEPRLFKDARRVLPHPRLVLPAGADRIVF